MSRSRPVATARCGAKTRSGGACRQWPIQGRKRCARHGGKTLRGAASGTFKHGRWSKYLPKRVGPRYEEAVADADLLALRDEIALTDAHIAEVLGDLTEERTAEDKDIWALVHELADHRSRLVEKEAKRLATLNQVLTAEQMMSMVGALVSLVREHVHDQETLDAISEGIGRLIEADEKLTV